MIRVLVVDDDALVRSALSLMLGGQADLQIVGEAADGQQALEAVALHRPDVVLMDIRIPLLNGLEATRELHTRPNPPRVIVLTTFGEDDYVVEAVASGADGFLLKDTPPANIVAAVRAVADGEAMLSPMATRALVHRVRRDRFDSGAHRPDDARRAATDRLAGLTEREREVATCVARGHTNAEIARELHLSLPTVKAHISRVFEKLAVTNRVQIAICLHDAGWV